MLSPQKQEKWNLNCQLFLSKRTQTATEIKELYIVNFEDKPKKCYMMSKNIILEADKEMMSIVDRMKMYIQRQTVLITVTLNQDRLLIEKGYQYLLGDFMVKIGSVILGQTTKGIVVEVEYLPCVIPNRCNDLLEEFIGNIGPFDSKITANFNYGEVAQLPDTYSFQHTTYQYVALLKSLGLFTSSTSSSTSSPSSNTTTPPLKKE